MIYYQPTTGDPHTAGIACRPRHCFLMTQLGGAIHPDLQAMRNLVERVLARHRFTVIDADSQTTGLRRAYLVCGEENYRERAREYFESAGLTGRAKNSVEVLLAQF